MCLLIKSVLQLLKLFYKRFIAILVFIRDIPILYISLFSFLITLISFGIYESIPIYTQNLKIFTIFILILLLIILLSTVFYLRNVSHAPEDVPSNSKSDVQILFIAIILGLRLTASFLEDYRTIVNLNSFTGGFEQKKIQILDIDRSRGDIQEVVFEYEGVKGVGYVDWFEDLKIGDLCNIYSRIERPENFDDFDYVRYLKNKNIYLKSSNIKINSCSNKITIKKVSDIFLWLKRNLRILRIELTEQVERYLPEPQASLLIGILFGSERAFSDQFEEQLRISGTTHIIAASGYNVTILILACDKILNFIKKKYRLLISFVLIWLYCILSGLGASILRATMMGSITILALLSGNVRNTHILVPSGVFLLLLIDPKIIFDIGFQLSILATLGLIYILPSIESVVEKIFKIQSVPQFFEENLLGTISCTLSTLPISISIFGKVSLVSVFANVLVLPLTESTMLYGTLALLGSFLAKNFSEVLFSTPYIQLKIFQRIVEFFGSISWGYVDVNTSWVGLLIGLFLFVFCIYFYPLDKENYYVKRFKDI
jgi:ComEC/Rec2-related protein